MMPLLTDVRTDQREQHAFLLVPIRPYGRERGVMTGLRREAGLRRVSTPS
jgi:hypothetical protein